MIVLKKVSRLVTAISLLAAATGCVKEKTLVHEPGSPIVFGAAAYYDGGEETRTDYSGMLFGTSRRYERIDWVKDYDRIRIFCLAAEDGPYSDYAITETPT